MTNGGKNIFIISRDYLEAAFLSLWATIFQIPLSGILECVVKRSQRRGRKWKLWVRKVKMAWADMKFLWNIPSIRMRSTLKINVKEIVTIKNVLSTTESCKYLYKGFVVPYFNVTFRWSESERKLKPFMQFMLAKLGTLRGKCESLKTNKAWFLRRLEKSSQNSVWYFKSSGELEQNNLSGHFSLPCWKHSVPRKFSDELEICLLARSLPDTWFMLMQNFSLCAVDCPWCTLKK